MRRSIRELVWCAAALSISFSPLLAAFCVSSWHIERAQRQAITQAYGPVAYDAGLRVQKNGRLTDGRPADPVAREIVSGRSGVPEIVAFAGTALLADFVLRRFFGGYDSQRPLVDVVGFGRALRRTVTRS